MAFNEIQPNNSDYLFPSNSLVPLQNTVIAASNNYEFQENASNLQSLTLSMGSASGKGSTCETSGDNSTNTVEAAAPRRTLDTFGQRTSIYRGVTRWISVFARLIMCYFIYLFLLSLYGKFYFFP